MNQDDIIRMALEAWGLEFIPESDIPKLERFFQAAYAAGATAEREACAKVCEEGGRDESGRIHVQAWGCAKAIRARVDVREHIISGDCWCNPELNYTDPETGSEVWVHKEPQ